MDNYNERRRIEKIKVFQLIQENLAILGIDRNAAMKTHPFNMKNLIALQAINLNIICTMMYIIVEVNTFFIIMQCIYEFSVNVSVLLIALVILLKLKESYACIDDCDSLVNAKLKYSASQSIFKEANQRVEKLSNIVFFLMVKITPGVVFLPSFIYSFIIYFAIDSENDPFTLPISFWFPFDWKNPVGYLIANIILYILSTCLYLIGGCLVATAIAFYLFFMAMSKTLKGSLFSIQRNAADKTERKHVPMQLKEFLEFHSQAKKLVSDCSDTFQYIALILFVWCLISISGALIMTQIQLTHDDPDLKELMTTAILAIYAFAFLLIACEICQRITLAFQGCSDMVEDCKWYRFPTKIQRMLPTILAFTQQPVEVNCFGSRACNRESFKSVVKKAYSYFTVLRTFNK